MRDTSVLWFAALTCGVASFKTAAACAPPYLINSRRLNAFKKMQAGRLGLFTGIFSEHYIDFPCKFILSVFSLKDQLEKV
jgi:hypothetical protein